MKIVMENEYDLLQLQYLFTDSTKGEWILGEGHEWMFRLRHVKTHREITIEMLRLPDNFREKIKDWMIENIYLWPHPNSPRQSENKQYQENAYARFLNRQFVKRLEKASKQVEEWPEWKRTLLGGIQ